MYWWHKLKMSNKINDIDAKNTHTTGNIKPFYKLDIKNFTLPSYESPKWEDFKMGSFIFLS